MHNQEDEEKLLQTVEKDTAKHLNQDTFTKLSMIAMIPNTWSELPHLSYGVNNEVPCLSSAVSIAYSKELDRHLIANQDIKIGTK
jgi:hypothetical protein